ncbi:family 78 glycoside hydrolase catalytic domain [Asticcacaulis solisilvae]|uniref:family 78 glycoside hydrolase catalytic domain n=1 Tax=Asticcacaulis solisilvae TaxID=1217274 RepID=UPI003FD720BD
MGAASAAGLLAALPAAGKAATATAGDLRVEWLTGPVGIDSLQPRFRWVLTAPQGARDVQPGPVRVIVASSEAFLKTRRGDIWDSGLVTGSALTVTPPAPLNLASHTPYYWAVATEEGAAQWSEPSQWVTGVIDGWRGRWIAAKPDPVQTPHVRGQTMALAAPEDTVLPIFRTDFMAEAVTRAVVSIAGLGHFELTVNGQPVTDSLLDPGWTEYDRTVFYCTYDVTRWVRAGGNRLGVRLGNGMYNTERVPGRKTKFSQSYGAPKFSLHMTLFMADGSVRHVISDESWQATEGPILFSSIYGGEDVDARRERPGWDTVADSNTDGWRAALEAPAPKGQLKAQPIPPVRQHRRFDPVKITEPKPGVFVYDLGENFAGRPDMVVRGPAGAKVRLRPCETLAEDGTVWQRSFNAGPEKGWVEWNYILAGQGDESFVPRFSYHGFRYLQVEPGEAEIVSIAGQFCYADLTQAGRFDCSDPLFVRIHKLIERAVLSNSYSVLTDCPHREKLGWLEQSHLNALTVFYNRDAITLYEKMARDIADTQKADGMVPGIAPEYVQFLNPDGSDADARNSPEWGGAVVLAPWAAYRQYGDSRILRDAWPAMQRYAGYLASRARGHILDFGLGDWYDYAPDGKLGPSQLTSRALSGTATYFQVLDTLARVAHVLGQPGDDYRLCAAEVRSAFNARFFNPGAGSYDRGSQTANAMPLALGMVPDGQGSRVLDALVRAVRASRNGVTAGDVGFHYVVRALTENGRDDVLSDMMSVTDRPSYGYMLARGATALTEAWNADPTKSLNHFMLGHAEGWLFGAVGGIRVDFADADGRVITVAPRPVGTLNHADVSHRTVFGDVRSRWRRKGGRIEMDVDIPPGALARIVVPGGKVSLVGSGRHLFTGRG